MFKKHEDGTYSFSVRFWTYAVVAGALIIWIGWRTQDTANKVESQAIATTRFAAETQDCFNQLVTILQARVELAAENDNWSKIQRTEFTLMFGELLNPPPEIKGLPASDPRRDKWSFEVATRHYTIINNAQHEQDANQAERSSHPIPDPNCGHDLPG